MAPPFPVALNMSLYVPAILVNAGPKSSIVIANPPQS